MRRILARLPESSRNRRGVTSRAGTAASVVAHTALITLAVVATGRSSASVAHTRVVDEHPVFVRTRPTEPTRPAKRSIGGTGRTGDRAPERTRFVLPSYDGPVVNVDFPTTPTSGPAVDDSWTRGTTSGGVGGGPGTGTGTNDDGGPYDARVVEIEAALRPGAPRPRYPEALRSERTEGRVVVRFVVDTAGRVEPASVRVVSSTHPLFTSAVRATLPSLRFTPARAHGARVRQLVELPFEFSLER